MHCEVRVFPRGDTAFGAEVERLVAATRKSADAHVEVLDQLRRTYPNATIHVREQLAGLGALEPMWYVYRDRRIRPEDPRRERLYRALAEARISVGDAGRVLARSSDAAISSGAPWSRERSVRRPPDPKQD